MSQEGQDILQEPVEQAPLAFWRHCSRLAAHYRALAEIRTYSSASITHSRLSSPAQSPGPPAPLPPRAFRNSWGFHSVPSGRWVASSRWRSSITDFSSVATRWSPFLIAAVVLDHSRWDSRSPCSDNGRAFGGVSFACAASNNGSFLPVCTDHVSG